MTQAKPGQPAAGPDGLEPVVLFVFGGVRRLRLPAGVAPEPPAGCVLRHRIAPDGTRVYVATPHPFCFGDAPAS